MIHIHTITSGPFLTNTYVVFTDHEKIASIIDPSHGSASLIDSFLREKNLSLTAIWLTHSHWDHIADAHALQKGHSKETLLPLYVHVFDEENVINPGADGLPLYFPINPSIPTHLFRHGDVLPLGKESFKVIHTPGHSPGSSCFLHEEASILFTGDTLFKGTYGNISFPTSSPEAMKESLQQLIQMKEDRRPLKIFPGHGETSFLREEKKWIEKLLRLD